MKGGKNGGKKRRKEMKTSTESYESKETTS